MNVLIQKKYVKDDMEYKMDTMKVVQEMGSIHDICDALSEIEPVEQVVVYTENKEATQKEGYYNIIDYNDVEYVDLHNINWGDVIPLDAELLTALAPYEYFCIEIARRVTSVSMADPRKYYLERVRYFNDFIEKFQINFCILSWMPHFGCDYMLYALMKAKKIPIVFFYGMPIDEAKRSQYFYLASSIEEQLVEVKNGNMNNYADIDFSFYCNQYTGHKSQATVGNLPVFKDRVSTLKFFAKKKPIKASVLFKKVIMTLRKDIKKRTGKKYYENHVTVPILNEQYVYFGLHYQPEGTTLPMGGYYVDQLLAIKELAFYLPEGVVLYVKEHPTKNFWRDKSYYEELSKIRNVKIIDKQINSLDLIKNAVAVATITGTMGWEALFNGKHVIMFGYYFYQYAPGVFSVRSNKDCEAAVNIIMKEYEKGHIVEMNELEDFLEKVKPYVYDVFYEDDKSCNKRRFNVAIREKIKNCYFNLH